jgi:hypothetical protein
MVWMLVSILLNRHLNGDPEHVRCARCGHIADQFEAPMRTSSSFTVSQGRPLDGYQMPPEWTCPSCGRTGPMEAGELLSNDTPLRCRRRFLCRYTWKVPNVVTAMTCPRCYTRQPGPAG